MLKDQVINKLGNAKLNKVTSPLLGLVMTALLPKDYAVKIYHKQLLQLDGAVLPDGVEPIEFVRTRLSNPMLKLVPSYFINRFKAAVMTADAKDNDAADKE